ncbi:hypothetical protein [Actinomadura violacea]|uniref:Uncharacterized protein n=1 Tax=Actinomadura violacea TaxID=2819934 RepID=A0ABS3RYU3_9ACTN|nr:hypothetical protein [Actinomadura violacea]MBO2461628.1 hypothetical protein [Actinomadura violacea]
MSTTECDVERYDADGQWKPVKTFTGEDCQTKALEWIANRITGSQYRVRPKN